MERRRQDRESSGLSLEAERDFAILLAGLKAAVDRDDKAFRELTQG